MIAYIIMGLITAILFIMLAMRVPGAMELIEDGFPHQWVFIVIWVLLWPYWVVKLIYELIRPKEQ